MDYISQISQIIRIETGRSVSLAVTHYGGLTNGCQRVGRKTYFLDSIDGCIGKALGDLVTRCVSEGSLRSLAYAFGL